MISCFFLLPFLLFETSLADCKYKFIHNASELIEFSNEVNSGTTYSDYTVYLVNDINFNNELSQQFVPIGRWKNDYDYNLFSGTFDGQGYTINNLVISSSSFQAAGLFGYSYGTTIRNVVIGSTCSIMNSHKTTGSDHTAGIIGGCYASSSSCIIENCVNMGYLKYSGSANYYIWVAGISAGLYVYSYSHYVKVTNCANYGTILNAGTSNENIAIGGIAGHINLNKKSNLCYVSNCINYGTIKNEGTTVWYYLGGLTGYSWGTIFDNCVSAGLVTSNVAGSYLGGILGYADLQATTMSHCYWTSATGCNYYYGTGSKWYNYVDSDKVTLSYSYANTMNTYAATNNWNEWSYNKNSNSIKFVFYDGNGFTHSKPMVLVPEPVRRGYSFLFWCVNKNSTACSKKYTHSTTGFTAATTLYAQWVANSCTVTFDVNGGNSLSASKREVSKKYDKVIGTLPVTSRRGYTFTGWYNGYGEQFTNESLVNNVCNCSLVAHWNPNKYTVILNVNRGNELANSRLTVTFDSKYGTIPSPTRDGFSFSGWFTKDNKQITSNTVVNITSTQTLYAHWGPIWYTVTLDVNGGDAIPSDKRSVYVPADKAYDYLPIPTRRGYAFAGWYTAAGGLITNDTTTTAIITKNQALYAHWTVNNYTVAFDVNGGDELPEKKRNKAVTFDSTYDYLPTPSRAGYTFDGWFTGNSLITNTTIVSIASDHTLYAWWTANEYTVEFNANGGDGLTIITVTFNRSYDCLPMPSREGYTFLWWYIKGTNEVVYNKTTVLTACNHVLCAAWDKNTIIFDVNGGEELEDDKMEVTYDGTYRTLPTPTRTGYTFDGWYTDDGVRIEGGSTVKISNGQTLHARWTPNKYTMPLNPNGGTLTDSKVTVTYHGYYGNLPTPTRTGYTFIGWYTENGETITITTIVTDPCHCVLSAGWEPDTYIIVFVTNGGNELGENEVRMEVNTQGRKPLRPLFVPLHSTH